MALCGQRSYREASAKTESESGVLSNGGTLVHVSIVVSDVQRREREIEMENVFPGKIIREPD